MTQKLHIQKKPTGSQRTPKPPRPFRRRLAFAALALGLALPGHGARAQDAVAMAAVAAAPQGNTDQKPLVGGPITLEGLKSIARTSVEEIPAKSVVDNADFFGTTYTHAFEGRQLGFAVTIRRNNTGSLDGRVAGATFFVDGVKIAAYNLDSYAQEFEQRTGQKLRYLAVAVREKESDEGKVLEVYLFGTYSKSRDDFDAGVPIIRSDYYFKYNQATEEEKIVVSMR